MRVTFRTSAVYVSLLGLLLAGCGGGDNTANTSGSSTTPVTRRYTIKDLGVAPTKAIARYAPRLLSTRVTGGTRAASVTDLGSTVITNREGVINNAGQVAGTAGDLSVTPQQSQAFIYQNGAKTDLPISGSHSFALDINASGQVVGGGLPGSDASTSSHAYLYSQGQATDLGTLGGSFSAATALNDAGQVVGISNLAPPIQNTPITLPDTRPARMFLYQSGQMSALPLVAGYNQAVPYAINNSGVVIGNATAVAVSGTSNMDVATNTNPVAFVIEQGASRLLPALVNSTTTGRAWTGAYGINNPGIIVGQAATTVNTTDSGFALHAVRWENDSVTDLGTLPTGNHSIALGINSAGDIVGGSTAEPNSLYDLGFLYHQGQMTNLNTLIDSGSGWNLLSAYSINDSGQIVGLGLINNAFHLYLLTPTTSGS